MMIEYLLRKRGNSSKWFNLTSKAKKKREIKIVILNIPCLIELACGASELVAYFTLLLIFSTSSQ